MALADLFPISVFRYACIGALIEFFVIAILIVSNGLAAYYQDLFGKIWAPFEYEKYSFDSLDILRHEDCLVPHNGTEVYTSYSGRTYTRYSAYCDPFSTLYFYDDNFVQPYKLAAGFGMALWILSYGITLLVFKCVYRDDEEERALLSSGHIFYHLIRWPILLGIAAVDDPLTMVFGYWIELMVLGLAGVCTLLYFLFVGIYALFVCCWEPLKDDIKEIQGKRRTKAQQRRYHAEWIRKQRELEARENEVVDNELEERRAKQKKERKEREHEETETESESTEITPDSSDVKFRLESSD